MLSRRLKLCSGDDWNSASTLTMPFQAGGATAMTWFNANGMAANGSVDNHVPCSQGLRISVSAPGVAALSFFELFLGQAVVSVVLLQLLTGQILLLLVVC